MATKSLRDISFDGLWKNNPALVQLLGLCPLLAVTGSVVNALGLGLATMMVLVGSNMSVSLIRNHVADAVRLPAFVMIIASFVTVAELVMQAFTYELYEVLGIFIPLIVTNCAILGRADAFACKNPVLPSVVDGLTMALGFTIVLVILGAMREILEKKNVKAENTVFVGNDLNDLSCFEIAGWSVAVADAFPEVIQSADYVLSKRGGHGAVRELCELILKSKDPKGLKDL